MRYNSQHLTVGVRNAPPLLNGELHKEIKLEEATWVLEDGATVAITLEKVRA